jgi:hypothetical protein
MGTLRLLLEPARADYSLDDDDVPVRVLLVNDGDDPVTVNARLAVSGPGGPGELTFSVIDPLGEVVPFAARVNLGRAGGENLATIRPTVFVGTTTDLVDYFAVSEPGTYRVSATYRATGGGEPGADHGGDGMPGGVWLGTVESDEVAIELRE